ncbi:MAG: cache domain-containing protein [Paracoccaceae bacterium]|nr:cache domain-containing protein [Paracoccaceae bacterium]
MTLRCAFLIFTLICASAMALLLTGVVFVQSARMTEGNLDYTVRFRTAVAAEDLARTLERDWRDLVRLSGQVAEMEPRRLSDVLSGIGGDGSRISWIGFADLSGQVVAANNDLLLGQSVSERPWFRNGLNGGFAGDVHDAVLLAKILNPASTDPLRFIDLAQPVIDDNGDPIGVLGIHINETWLENYLRETAALFNLDLFLINPNGEVSASSTGEAPSAADLQILRAAQTGVQSQERETWPDGRDYFASLVPEVSYGELPSFGWRMIGRLDAEAIDFRADFVRQGALYASLVAVGLSLAAAFIFSKIFMVPITSLAKAAANIAEGSQDYPHSSRVTHEAALLSDALTRLQNDRVSDGS